MLQKLVTPKWQLYVSSVEQVQSASGFDTYVTERRHTLSFGVIVAESYQTADMLQSPSLPQVPLQVQGLESEAGLQSEASPDG